MNSLLAAVFAVAALGGAAQAKQAPGATTNVRAHARVTRIGVRRPTVVVFAPASWAAEAKTDEGTSEMAAHLYFAVDDVKKCKGATPIDVRMIFSDRLKIDIDGRHENVDVSNRFPDSAGSLLLKPGKKMCAIATPNDTASLGNLLSHAVGAFFNVPACLKEGMSDPCGGGGG